MMNVVLIDALSQQNSEFCCIVAHQMLQFRDIKSGDLMAESILASNQNRNETSDHKASVAERATRVRCCVCRVEEGNQNILKKTADGRQQMKNVLGISSAFRVKKSSYTRKWIASCSSEGCTLYAHCIVVKSDNVIFWFPEFHGLSCFDIAHHPLTAGLWTSNPNHKTMLGQTQARARNDMESDVEHSGKSDDDNGNERKKLPRAYNVNTSHPLYIRLRNEYGLNAVSRVKGAKSTAEAQEVDEQEE
jgi:hypothetical protein